MAMGKIKSAWEIALEKTEGITIDKEKMKYQSDVEKARKAAGSYMLADKADDEAFINNLKDIDPKAVKEGLLMTADANISLPESEEGNEERFRRIKTIIAIASDNNSNALALTDELIGFLNQYPLHRKDLVEKMKAQYKPILDEKSEKLSKQYGQDIHLTYENDKEFIFPELVPGDLVSLRTAISFPGPGKYRIYDIGFGRTRETEPDSSVNHIRNGGAERGWYGVGVQGRKYIMSSNDMLIHDGLGHTWTDTISLSLDRQIKRSGKYSFRYERKPNQTGRFTLNPVPFVPGKSATLTAWCRGSRPKQRVYLGLFLGSGITYSGGADITNDRWTKCELHIPVWGKKPDGRIYLVGDPVNGYAAVNRVALPEIGSQDPVWIDDVTYHIGGRGSVPESSGITAHAVLDSKKQ